MKTINRFYYFIILIIVLVGLFLLYNFLSNTKIIEYFNSVARNRARENRNKPTFVLLGDSILKNESYVNDGKSVENLLIKKNKGKVYSYAMDQSKIVDIYGQVNDIPLSLNGKNTYVFLSAGGNDILTHYVDKNQDVTDSSILDPMFASYKNIVKSIQTRLPKVKLVLLDIYYPENMQYKQFHPIIEEWNDMLYSFSRESKNKIHKVLKISEKLTNKDDFSFNIEPSSAGSVKIVDLIVNAV